MIVGWTGHRPDIFREPRDARNLIDLIAREMARAGDVEFMCGGQRGVDLWVAAAAHALSIPFTIVLPIAMRSFTSGWDSADVGELPRLLAASTDVEIVDRRAVMGPLAYDRRNELIAGRSDRLVAVWTDMRRGGT